MDTTFVLLLSPAGGGKTTLIRNTVPVLAESGKRVAIIFNDDGDSDAVDMPSEVRRYADLETMTAGCFGCDDADTLVATLQRLNGSVNVVFVEPIGFTAAGEILNVFGRAGIDPFVVTLVDAEHLTANLRIGTLGGQVAAADAVLITKETSDNRDAVLTYVRQHMGIGVRVYSHPATEPYTYGFVKADVQPGLFHSVSIPQQHAHVGVLKPHHHHCGHHHAPGEACSHDHHHDHVHIVPRHLRLQAGVTLEDVQGRFAQIPAIRAKGKAGNARFSMVHGTWTTDEGDITQPNFVTYYTVTSAEADTVAEALACIVLANRYASRGTADEVRDHIDDGSLLLEVLEQCERAPLTFVDGHPVSNTEAQELLNELRKRAGVSEEMQARAVRARVHHLIRCAKWYREDKFLTRFFNEMDAPWQTMHGIAVGIAWFCSEQPERVGEELITEAKSLPIIRFLAYGLIRRKKTNADLDREEVFADEAAIAARWSTKYASPRETGYSFGMLKHAYLHALLLAKKDGRLPVVLFWASVVDSFLS